MGLTSQNLSDAEKDRYKRIEAAHKDRVNEIRQNIIKNEISPNSQVSKDIAAAIRTQILTAREFRNIP
jgi:hypothetical protein